MMRACFVLVLVVLGSPIALAEEAPGRLPPSTEEAARDAMEDHFAGEKLGGYILGGLGAAGLGSASPKSVRLCSTR